MRNHDPKVQVTANLAEAEELIRQLQTKMDGYSRLDKVNWGHAGELDHINHVLRQLLGSEEA